MKNRLQNKPISDSLTKAVAVLTIISTASASFAQTPASPTPTSPRATRSSDEARQHYERGVKLDLADTQTVVQAPGGEPSTQPVVEPANRTPAYIALGVAAVGIGVATYAFLAAKPHVVEPQPAPVTGLHVEPMLGVGSAGILGRF
ncbi:MAG: hypothetical protein ACRELY_21220 [Polyangiaceae bacterium]